MFFYKKIVAYSITIFFVIFSTLAYVISYGNNAHIEEDNIVISLINDMEENLDEFYEYGIYDYEMSSYGIQNPELYSELQAAHRVIYGFNAFFFEPRFIPTVFAYISPTLDTFVTATKPVFTQLGSVNNLTDTHMYIEGYIVEITEVGAVAGGILMITEYGKIFLNAGLAPSSTHYLDNFFQPGNLIRAYFIYSGLSSIYNLPMGFLIAVQKQTFEPLESIFLTSELIENLGVFELSQSVLVVDREEFLPIPNYFFIAEPAASQAPLNFLYIEGYVTDHISNGFVLEHENGRISLITRLNNSSSVSSDYFQSYAPLGDNVRVYFAYLGMASTGRLGMAFAFSIIE